MKKILLLFFRQFMFWMLFFAVSRLIFLIYYTNLLAIDNVTLREGVMTFISALKLDVATACYLMIIPFFLLLIRARWNSPIPGVINKIYGVFLIIGYSLTVVGEMGIYAEWKTKLTYKVLKYFLTPGEIFNSAETTTFFLLLLIFIGMVTAGSYLYLKLIYREPVGRLTNNWYLLVFGLITPVGLFIGMRGGFQQIPINQSESYFSQKNILNVAAVNNLFNLYISIFENLTNFNHNPYVFMDKQEADKIMAGLYASGRDSTVMVLSIPKPNVVMLILESWSADLIESLGGKPGITPEFHHLEKEGLLFDEFYAAGSRSEQGMASIFSGFPAHPVSSITVQPDKYIQLPSMVAKLKSVGYQTSFYFGGQLIYGNMKSYMIFTGFDKIMEEENFPDELPEGKLGIHDQYTLEYLLSDLDKMKPPFFASLFTVSTHSPWDQPFHKPIQWGENEREYLNAAYYTDHCLGDFFRKARQKPWFDSTLFIIVADHSHNSYRNWHPHSREYHRIPMLFAGPVVKDEYRGKTWSKIGNQHDIPAILLAQLGIDYDEFRYSKNLLAPGSRDFAYISTEDGVCWYTPGAIFAYDKTSDYYYWWTSPVLPDSVRKEGLAYLQTVFSDYLGN